MLTLQRYCYSREMGTFGVLTLEDGWQCFTVERPWLGNTPSVSCIPEGIYDLELGRYEHGGYDAYEVMRVSGRSGIKIHIANLATDVQGCIGLGEREGWIAHPIPGGERMENPPRWGVTKSKATFEEFMRRMGGRKRDVLRISQRHI